jgi:hypothetical protein
MAHAVAVAYWTTGFGIVNALAGSLFGLALRLLAPRAEVRHG